MEHTPALIETAMDSKAWPFEEARKLLQRMERMKSPPSEILFETGYGPSGLPHLGTFGEVARTTMVRRAFEILSVVPTRLIAFSDDMDGLRRVPDNIPNQDHIAKFLELPLLTVEWSATGDFQLRSDDADTCRPARAWRKALSLRPTWTIGFATTSTRRRPADAIQRRSMSCAPMPSTR